MPEFRKNIDGAPRANAAEVKTNNRVTAQGNSLAQLAIQLVDNDPETARAAKRAMWKTVRLADRPDAGKERRNATRELMALLSHEQPDSLLREVSWMLSEIGSDDSVPAIAALLTNTAVREDARMSLERIPGAASLTALRTALKTVPDDFKINIAQSLRARGETVDGLPCEKLTPTKQTKVKASS